MIRHVNKFYSKHSDERKLYYGDTDQALRVTNAGNDVYVASADEDNRLMLEKWHLSASDGSFTDYSFTDYEKYTAKFYRPYENDRFDKVEIACCDRRGHLVVAERAEDTDDLTFKEHWLRVSLWSSSAHSLKEVSRLAMPDRDSRDSNGTRNLDMALIDGDHFAVVMTNKFDKNKLKVFRIEDDLSITELHNLYAGPNEVYDGDILHVAADESVIATGDYGYKSNIFFWRFDNGTLGADYVSQHVDGRLLDLAIINSKETGERYVVAICALGNEDKLSIYSWKIEVDDSTPVGLRGHTKTYTYDVGDGDYDLVGKQAGFERASIVPFYTYGNTRPGFLIVAKGFALRLKEIISGDLKESAKGIKVLYGTILTDGQPTIWDSDVIGSGDEDAGRMIHITGTGGMMIFPRAAFVTVHQTSDKDAWWKFWSADRYLSMNSWLIWDKDGALQRIEER